MPDYNKLVEALRCCGNEGCHKCPYKKHIHEKFCWVIAMKDAADAIEELQAQLPKRGEWITKGQDIFCSVCGEESAFNWCGASKFSNYCPKCGAKMEVQDGQ